MFKGHVLEGNDWEVHFICVATERKKKKQPLLVFKQPPFYHK